MEVTILLATAANIDASGQANALNLGWEIIGPSPLPSFVVFVVVKVPLDRGEEPFDIELRLLDSTGTPVVLGEEDARQPVELRVQGQAGPSSSRPAGLRGGAGTLLEIGPGMVLEPGIYEWVVSVDGKTQPHWHRPFYVRAKRDEFPPQRRG
jgi:hypothetical protein